MINKLKERDIAINKNITKENNLLKKKLEDQDKKIEELKNEIKSHLSEIDKYKNEIKKFSIKEKENIREKITVFEELKKKDIIIKESNKKIETIKKRYEDGIKFLKELKMIGSNYQYKGKKKSGSVNNKQEKNQEKKENKKIDKNPSISKFVNVEEENNKKEEINKNELENIYSTIKSENMEIKKEVIKEVKEINEIIISSKPKEIIKNEEIISYYNDKKKLAKLNLYNSITEDFCSIENIQHKFQEKNIRTYYNDTKKTTKINIIDNNENIYPINVNENKEEFNVINLNSSCNSNNEEIIIIKRKLNNNIMI